MCAIQQLMRIRKALLGVVWLIGDVCYAAGHTRCGHLGTAKASKDSARSEKPCNALLCVVERRALGVDQMQCLVMDDRSDECSSRTQLTS
jgi:hypothetical protein